MSDSSCIGLYSGETVVHPFSARDLLTGRRDKSDCHLLRGHSYRLQYVFSFFLK